MPTSSAATSFLSAENSAITVPSSPSPTPISQSTSPLPQPLSVPRQSYTGAAHGAFTPAEVPPWITKFLVPSLFVGSLAIAIGYTVANAGCSYAHPVNGEVNKDVHFWCCLSPFTRYLTLISYWFHAALCAWFIYLYHLPLIRFLPSSRRYYLPSFIFKVFLLVTIWMIYFLFLSLSLISTLPEQMKDCSATSADRGLFLTTDIVAWAVCIMVKVMLGIMGKKVWKYWELRHLTPAELVAYEEAMETNRARGLTKDQIAVLTKVTLTCTHGTTTMIACPVCGHSEYQPPSFVASVTAVVNDVLHANVRLSNLFSTSRHPSSPKQSNTNHTPSDNMEVELPSFSHTGTEHTKDNITLTSQMEEGRTQNQNTSLLNLTDSSSPNSRFLPPSDRPEEKSRATLVPVGGQSSMTCAICLEDYLVHGRVMILPCRHHGHVDCLLPWFNGHLTCPTCRAKVVRD
jgi:hypothetical protein